MTISILFAAFIAFVCFCAGAGTGLMFLQSVVDQRISVAESDVSASNARAIIAAVTDLNDSIATGELTPISQAEKRASLERVK